MASRGAQLSFDVVGGQFNDYLDEMHSLAPEIEFKVILEAEAISIIGNALQRTHAAEASTIRANFAAREWTSFGGKKYRLDWRFSDALWARIQQFRQDHLAYKLAARGLAKQTWYYLALAMGKVVPAPAYVVSANYKGRHYPEDVDAKWVVEDGKLGLELHNNSPMIPYASMELALKLAMLGRIGYFQQNLKHRAFQSAASRAAKYPGIFVSEG